MGKVAGGPLPVYISRENSHKIKDVLQGIGRYLQEVISKATQKYEEVTQVVSKEFWEQYAPN